MRIPSSRVALAATAMVLSCFGAVLAHASDHRDGPAALGAPATDITDIYAFRSPANPNNLVVMLNVNPFTTASVPAAMFSSNARYLIHVDNNGDLKDDATVVFTFSGTPLMWKAEGLGASALTGLVTPLGQAPIVYDSGGIKIFCGPRDDPFFFDLDGFKHFLAAPIALTPGHGLRPSSETPVDFFAGANVAAIVLELPITALTGAANANTGTIKAWASTEKKN